MAISTKLRTCSERFDRRQASAVRLRKFGWMIGRVSMLQAMVPVFEEYPEFIEATRCVRIEFTADRNLSTFPPGLGVDLPGKVESPR